MRRFSDAKLAILETQGIKLTESRFFARTYYKPDKDGINIYTEKCGDLQINWENLDDFVTELMEFREVYDAAYNTRRTMRKAKTKAG